MRRNVAILVVGPEEAEEFRDYFTEHNLPYIGLPDPTHYVMKLCGQEIDLFKLGRLPVQVLIDKQGIARYAHYGLSIRDIPTNEEMFALLDDMNRPFNSLL